MYHRNELFMLNYVLQLYYYIQIYKVATKGKAIVGVRKAEINYEKQAGGAHITVS